MWLSGLTLSISGGAKRRPLIETKRHGLVTVNFPDPFCGIPFASNTFDTALQFGFLEFNAQSNNLLLLRWRPAGFFERKPYVRPNGER